MRRKLYLTSTAAIALAMAVQGVPVKTAQAQDADADFSIEEIIVTARKREENIQDAPLSVAAFTSNMIESANIKTLDDIAKFTAGFSFDEDFQRSNSDRPVIRGQSTILGSSGVSTFIDGVLITGTILDYDLNDVERIEIIKGPQSALYGRNTYSGAISIITKSPTDETSGQVKMEKAEFNQADFSASVRGPINDQWSYSLTGRFYDRGGPFLNTFDDTAVGQQNSKSLSGVLYYQPNSQLDIRFRARYSTLSDDQPRLFTTDPTENNCFFDDGGVYNGNGRYFCGKITEQAISIDDVRLLGEKGSDKTQSYQTSMTVDYEVSDALTVTWINGYNHSRTEQKGDFGYSEESFNPFTLHLFDAPFGPPPTPFTSGVVIAGPVIDFALDAVGSGWDYSSELRVAYEGDSWDLLVGGYFFNSKSTSNSNRTVPPGFADTVSEAYFGEIDRMVAVCNANVSAFAGPCTPQVFNVAVDDLFPGGAFVDFAFAFNTIGLTMLTLEADRSTFVTERDNLAAFAQFSKDVTDKLTLTAEARVTREEVTSLTQRRADIYDFTGALVNSTRAGDIIRNRSKTDVNPRFTAQYKVRDGSNVYAVGARGSKPGGFNSTLLDSLGLDTFDDESVWSYEIGSKNVLMDGRLIVNVAGFYNTISGYQLTQSIVIPTSDGSPPSETTTAISNVGKVRLKGIELEMVFAPAAVPGLVFNANYAYTDSDILEGTDINEGKLNDVLDDGLVNCSLGLADPAVACITTGDNTLPGSIVGRQLPRQAKHMYNIGANFTQAVSENWSIVMNANVSHESKKFVQVHNLAWVGAATLVNASIGFENENLRLVVWGKNLTEEDAVVSASRFADEGASFQRNFMGNPRIGRQFGATASYKF